MHFFRRSPTCLLFWVLLTSLLYTTWTFATWLLRPRDSSVTGNFQYTCNMTNDYRYRLEQILEKTHQILDQLQLEHFLCFSTLWGQIRLSTLLPWSPRAHLCVLHDQFAAIDEGILYHSFQQEYLRLHYSAAEAVYTVERNHHRFPQLQLIVFIHDPEQNVYKRTGWRRRLLPPDCTWTPILDCFPAHLLQRPLPTQRLGRHEYPVPMGGIELQKYHYAEDWWKPVAPKRNCNVPPTAALIPQLPLQKP